MDDEERVWMENCARSLRDSGLNQLLPVLREGLCHLTDAAGYAGIRSSGYIEPNDGRFPNSFERSAHSYGRSRGFISLFDFETPTLDTCVSEEPKWTTFFVQRKPSLVLIRLDGQKLAAKLVPNERAREEVGLGRPVWMPHIEVWYPDPIPFSWTTELVHIVPTPSVRFEKYDATEEDMKQLDHALQEAEKSYVHEDDMDILARVFRSDDRGETS